jgi:hypothetical protein
MSKDQILKIIEKIDLTADFSINDFNQLLACSEEVSYQHADYIVSEKSTKSDMFILLEGKLDVCKKEKNKEIIINSLYPGDCFGEITFFSGKPRSASVRANGSVKLLLIKHDCLNKYPDTYRKLELSAYRRDYELILNSNQKIARSIQKQIEFARIFTASMIVLMISNLFIRMLSDIFHGIDISSSSFVWSYLLILAIPFILIIKFNREDLATFGFSLTHWKRAITESGILSLLAIAIFGSIIFYKAHVDNQPWTSYIKESNLSIVAFSIYVIHASIQEFLRSIFYLSLLGLYGGKKSMATILSALVFSTLHLHFGYIAILIMFVAALLFNLLQDRQKTLLGIILFHSVVGWAAFTMKLI